MFSSQIVRCCLLKMSLWNSLGFTEEDSGPGLLINGHLKNWGLARREAAPLVTNCIFPAVYFLTGCICSVTLSQQEFHFKELLVAPFHLKHTRGARTENSDGGFLGKLEVDYFSGYFFCKLSSVLLKNNLSQPFYFDIYLAKVF